MHMYLMWIAIHNWATHPLASCHKRVWRYLLQSRWERRGILSSFHWPKSAAGLSATQVKAKNKKQKNSISECEKQKMKTEKNAHSNKQLSHMSDYRAGSGSTRFQVSNLIGNRRRIWRPRGTSFRWMNSHQSLQLPLQLSQFPQTVFLCLWFPSLKLNGSLSLAYHSSFFCPCRCLSETFFRQLKLKIFLNLYLKLEMLYPCLFCTVVYVVSHLCF